MTLQRTLKKSVSISGIGIHSGKEARLTLKPGNPNQGIVFVRTDLEGAPRISAHYKNVVNTQLATTLGRGDVKVSTVEHVLAALQGLGVDNAVLEVSGPEVPILDGSSKPFCVAIEKAGIITQLQPRPYLALRKRVEIKLAGKWAVAEPSSRLEIHGSIEWDHPAIGYQEFHYVEGKTQFSELSSARTFCLLKDYEALKKMGLARGGSLENAIVLDDASVLNPEGLRYPDELARHKVLDALGDLKLAGIAIQGYIRLHRAGHDLHSQLISAIFQDPDNYEIVDDSSKEGQKSARLRAALARAGLVATF
jgi:UDP-3-O-[3-hydroxymyristoyl] N-acetylglucosamine deacetylase